MNPLASFLAEWNKLNTVGKIAVIGAFASVAGLGYLQWQKSGGGTTAVSPATPSIGGTQPTTPALPTGLPDVGTGGSGPPTIGQPPTNWLPTWIDTTTNNPPSNYNNPTNVSVSNSPVISSQPSARAGDRWWEDFTTKQSTSPLAGSPAAPTDYGSSSVANIYGTGSSQQQTSTGPTGSKSPEPTTATTKRGGSKAL